MSEKRCSGCLTEDEKNKVIALTNAVELMLPKITSIIEKTDEEAAERAAIQKLQAGVSKWLKAAVGVVAGASVIIGMLVTILSFAIKAINNGIL